MKSGVNPDLLPIQPSSEVLELVLSIESIAGRRLDLGRFFKPKGEREHLLKRKECAVFCVLAEAMFRDPHAKISRYEIRQATGYKDDAAIRDAIGYLNEDFLSGSGYFIQQEHKRGGVARYRLIRLSEATALHRSEYALDRSPF